MVKKASAVIVTFNNDVMLKGLIGDFLSQACLLDEIIVVDNTSTDNTFQIISDKEFARTMGLAAREKVEQ